LLRNFEIQYLLFSDYLAKSAILIDCHETHAVFIYSLAYSQHAVLVLLLFFTNDMMQ